MMSEVCAVFIRVCIGSFFLKEVEVSVTQKAGKKGGVKRTKTTAQATSTTPHPTVSSQSSLEPFTTSTPSPSPLTASMTTTTVLPGGMTPVTPSVQPIIKVWVCFN